MINLNIQKTYRNAYAKTPGVQSDSGDLNNIKQDTVSFNGWFSKKQPKILVSQEAYQKICEWAANNDGSYAVFFMQHLKKLCEGEIIGPNVDNAFIGASSCEIGNKAAVEKVLQEALNTSIDDGLSSFIRNYFKVLCKETINKAKQSS